MIVLFIVWRRHSSGSDKGYKIYTHCCKSYSVEVRHIPSS